MEIEADRIAYDMKMEKRANLNKVDEMQERNKKLSSSNLNPRREYLQRYNSTGDQMQHRQENPEVDNVIHGLPPYYPPDDSTSKKPLYILQST